MSCIARTLGAPETVPAGKQARRSSNGVTPSFISPDDLGDEVRDVREALRLEQAARPEPFPGTQTRERSLRPEVDEHHVLGAVLLRGEQALGVASPGCVVPAIGFRLARRPSALTSVSGEEPTVPARRARAGRGTATG